METVDLPALPPLEPMLAKAQTKVPPEAGVWSYDPSGTDSFTELVKTAECRPATFAIRQRQRVKVGLLERYFLKS